MCREIHGKSDHLDGWISSRLRACSYVYLDFCIGIPLGKMEMRGS